MTHRQQQPACKTLGHRGTLTSEGDVSLSPAAPASRTVNRGFVMNTQTGPHPGLVPDGPAPLEVWDRAFSDRGGAAHMATVTHPHPTLIEPFNWCTACHTHAAEGTLCPVCRDDATHGIQLLAHDPDAGKGAE